MENIPSSTQKTTNKQQETWIDVKPHFGSPDINDIYAFYEINLKIEHFCRLYKICQHDH